jgi:hypothetical protein
MSIVHFPLVFWVVDGQKVYEQINASDPDPSVAGSDEEDLYEEEFSSSPGSLHIMADLVFSVLLLFCFSTNSL